MILDFLEDSDFFFFDGVKYKIVREPLLLINNPYQLTQGRVTSERLIRSI